MAKYTVAVAGATGYAGGEALRILAAHPDFDITCRGQAIPQWGSRWPSTCRIFPKLANLVVEDTTPEVLNGHDVIILALPHGASGKLASQLDPNAVVVDWAPTIASKNRPLGMSSTAAISMSIGPTACPSSSPAKLRTAPTPASVRRFLAPSASQVLAATSPPPRWPSSPASPKDWLNRRISWPIWSSDTRVPARISSAPTCLPPRPCNPPCHIRWAASTATFPNPAELRPRGRQERGRSQRIHARLHTDSRPHVPRYPRHRVRPHDGQGQDTER